MCTIARVLQQVPVIYIKIACESSRNHFPHVNVTGGRLNEKKYSGIFLWNKQYIMSWLIHGFFSLNNFLTVNSMKIQCRYCQVYDALYTF